MIHSIVQLLNCDIISIVHFYVINNSKFDLFSDKQELHGSSTYRRPEHDMYSERCFNCVIKQDAYERSDTYESEFNYLNGDIQISLNKFFKKYEELKDLVNQMLN